MMKNLIAVVGLYLTISATAWATDSPLVDLQKRYQQATLLAAEFTQEKQTPFISTPLVSTGHFQFAQDNGLIWAIDTPFVSQTLFVDDSVFIADATGQWQVSPHDLVNQAVADILSELFSANWQNLEEQFTIHSATPSAVGNWRVVLSPTSLWMKKALKRIEIQGKQTIEKIIVHDNQDSQTVLRFSAFTVQHDALSAEQVSDFAHP